MDRANNEPFKGQKNLVTVGSVAGYLGKSCTLVRNNFKKMGIPVIELGPHGDSWLVDWDLVMEKSNK
jgi:hypothetical protein